MDLRDPIWEGIAALIAILSALIAVTALLFPELKKGIDAWIKERLAAPSCGGWALAILLILLLLICLPLTPIAVRTIESGLATATPTATYTYLFTDNFDIGVLPDWTPDSGTWQMVNNHYTMTNVGTDWTRGRTFVGQPTWTDYRLGVSLDLSNRNPSRNSEAEILVRVQDPNNFLVLLIRRSDLFENGYFRCYWMIVSNGQATPIGAANFALDAIPEPISIQIEVQGEIVTTFINNQQASRWSGAPFLNGGVGLGINSRNPHTPPTFDDFFVRLVNPN